VDRCQAYITLFVFVTNGRDKLASLYIAGFFRLGLLFVSKDRSLPIECGSSLTHKYWTSLKNYPVVNTLAYFVLPSVTKKKRLLSSSPGLPSVRLRSLAGDARRSPGDKLQALPGANIINLFCLHH